jgi:hypothetical protein
MSDNVSALRKVLQKFMDSSERLRFFGNGMVILAEGFVAHVGDDVVSIKHHMKEEPDEFLRIDCIVKIAILGEYRQY